MKLNKKKNVTMKGIERYYKQDNGAIQNCVSRLNLTTLYECGNCIVSHNVSLRVHTYIVIVNFSLIFSKIICNSFVLFLAINYCNTYVFQGILIKKKIYSA